MNPNLNRLISTLPPMPNLRHGACISAEADLFFDPDREHAAKQVCRQCPVLLACRNYALANREKYGVWGGLTEAERKAILTDTPPPAKRELSPCGTRASYNRGCRCAACRKANTEYCSRRVLLKV